MNNPENDYNYNPDPYNEKPIRKKITLDLELDPITSLDSQANPYVKIIHLAEAVNAWRIFPRIFISMYMYLVWRVVEWYVNLPNPTMEQSGLISVIIGAGAAWFGLYTNTGGFKSIKVGREIFKNK